MYRMYVCLCVCTPYGRAWCSMHPLTHSLCQSGTIYCIIEKLMNEKHPMVRYQPSSIDNCVPSNVLLHYEIKQLVPEWVFLPYMVVFLAVCVHSLWLSTHLKSICCLLLCLSVGHNLHINAFFVLAVQVQRIDEYHKLLVRLSQLTSGDHPDYYDLQYTVTCVESVS